jgi:tRNA(Arg) A34 adenosine deaminase TadA
VIVRGGKIIAAAHNTVHRDQDPTAHAEVNAIRQAGRSLQTINLAGGVMFTTCEPCPMCLAAIHWAKIDTVYYGASIADAQAAGFAEMQVPAAELTRIGGSRLQVVAGPCRDECKRLFSEWKQAGLSSPY